MIKARDPCRIKRILLCLGKVCLRVSRAFNNRPTIIFKIGNLVCVQIITSLCGAAICFCIINKLLGKRCCNSYGLVLAINIGNNTCISIHNECNVFNAVKRFIFGKRYLTVAFAKCIHSLGCNSLTFKSLLGDGIRKRTCKGMLYAILVLICNYSLFL